MTTTYERERHAKSRKLLSAGSARSDDASTFPGHHSGESEDGEREIRHNHSVFRRAIAIAEARLSAGRYQSALEWCRVASSHAMTNPIGPIRSDALEQAVDRVAKHMLQVSTPPTPVRNGRLRVLHVLTEAATIGGLTRFVQRWIARDADSVSSVVITRQPEVIASLAAAAESSGGCAVGLGRDLGDSIERGARLRRLAGGADVVVCHLHSDDVVAALAFGSGYQGAPVAIYNHADHLFWLAPTKASLIVEAREVGLALTLDGRGYSPTVIQMLPLLVPTLGSVTARDEARASLGFRAIDVVALTVARAVKYHDTPLHPRFSEIVVAALDDHPQLVICVVGPTQDAPPWPSLLQKYPERLRVTGPVADPAHYLSAADIYLDPFPFSSTTSLLEAAASSLPTLTLDAHRGLRRALGAADFVATEADRPKDFETYLGELATLIQDAELRLLRGSQARARYLAITPEEPWLDQLRVLYARLGELSRQPRSIDETPAPRPNRQLIDYALAVLAVEQRVPLLWTMSASFPRFDNRDRGSLRMRILIARIARKVATALGIEPWPTDSVLLPWHRKLQRDISPSVR